MPTSTTTRFLSRPEGRIAYDVQGTGTLVVCVPGMGDLRSVYRYLAPVLVAAGYRVATMDLRGHGESDTTFARFDGVATGGDVLALIAELGGEPAVVVGNSLGAAGAAWAAAEAPAAVAALVLVGPFVREVPISLANRVALRVGLMRPWGLAAWSAYSAKLYPGRQPADLPEHRAAVRASLARTPYWKAFIATTKISHAPVEARLAEIHAPTLVVMGSKDPDFPDPAAEAKLVADRLGGSVVMVPGAGHYPQAQEPELVGPAIVDFLSQATGRG